VKNKWLFIGASTLWGLAAIPALAPVMMMSIAQYNAPAPGSTASRLIVALYLCLLSLPAFCLLGATVPWIFWKKRFGAWLFVIPLLDVAAIVILTALIDAPCSGSLSC
jgi:hypothetical protein